jgi:hypothetical protein
LVPLVVLRRSAIASAVYSRRTGVWGTQNAIS